MEQSCVCLCVCVFSLQPPTHGGAVRGETSVKVTQRMATTTTMTMSLSFCANGRRRVPCGSSGGHGNKLCSWMHAGAGSVEKKTTKKVGPSDETDRGGVAGRDESKNKPVFQIVHLGWHTSVQHTCCKAAVSPLNRSDHVFFLSTSPSSSPSSTLRPLLLLS